MTYISQRGSKVVCVARVATVIPDLPAVCGNAEMSAAVLDILGRGQAGVLLILGSSLLHNNLVAYALLQHLNQGERLIIHCIEPTLSFLLRHDNSIVIQTEIDIDVPSVEAAIRMGMQIRPHVIFLGDVRNLSDLGVLTAPIESRTRVLATVVTTDPVAVIRELRKAATNALGSVVRHLRGSLQVTPTSSLTASLTWIHETDRQ